MGYLVIVHVDSIDDARKLAKRSEASTDSTRVVGVFRMPSRDELVCEGSPGCKESGWKRLSPEGHMVHGCGRRNRNWRTTLAGHAGGMLDTYGVNLLARDHTPALFRNPEGWGRDAPERGESRIVDLY